MIKGTISAQCPDCKRLKVILGDSKVKWEDSIAIFNNMKKEQCFNCKKHD